MLRAAWGTCLALMASGVRVCRKADGFLIGDPPILRQKESRAIELQLVCVPPEQEAMAPSSLGQSECFSHHISLNHSFLRMS